MILLSLESEKSTLQTFFKN